MDSKKQTQAKNLFFQTDLSKTQIAGALGIPRRTLHYWIRQHNWDRQKESADLMPSLLAENCYHVINRFTQQILTADTITHKDAEALHKFTITVNKLKNRTTLNENMEIFGRFMDSVGKRSPEIAQVISPFVDDYISTQSENNMDKLKPIPKTTTPEEISEELKLDQEDIKAWAEENDPLLTGSQPHAAQHDEISMESHIENFKQMFPGLSAETLQEFRQFHQEHYGVGNPNITPEAA